MVSKWLHRPKGVRYKLIADERQSSDPQVSQMLRDLSGIDDAQARKIVNAWLEWPQDEVLGTISELRRVAEVDRSLEFDSLFRAATTFPSSDVRSESVRALASGGSVKIAQSLIAVIEGDESSTIRAAAAESLYGFSDPTQSRNVSSMTLGRVSSALRNAANMDEPLVRGKALISLAALRDEEAPDLIDAMFDEAIGNGPLMADVLCAMGETGDRSWLPTIEDAFYSNDAQVRIAAVAAFGNLAGDDDVDALSEPFDDHVLEVQMATIKALEQIGTDQAREMLSLAETSSEPEVQELASAALTALKADDDLIYAVSPTMIERGLFGVPASARRPGRDLSRYDAPTEEGWANVDSEGLEQEVAPTAEDIGEDFEDYLESEEFFRDSNTN